METVVKQDSKSHKEFEKLLSEDLINKTSDIVVPPLDIR